jgi:hypothetical protein
MRHLLLANTHAFGLPTGGSMAAHVGVVLVWTVAGLLVAVRRFRWAPHR